MKVLCGVTSFCIKFLFAIKGLNKFLMKAKKKNNKESS